MSRVTARASIPMFSMRMRVPGMVWDRRHNIAALTVSFGGRIWHTREIGDYILGYNAAGRLARVVLLDPRRVLPPQVGVSEALALVIQRLMRFDEVRETDISVLESALDRAGAADQRSDLESRGDISTPNASA